MPSIGLYDMLTGCFPSERPGQYGQPDETLAVVKTLSEEQQLRMSIIENLRMILQTRRGSVVHLPDFGIPDVFEVYTRAENSLDPVRAMIKETITRYEPRLSGVRVDKDKIDEGRISVSILGEIAELGRTEILLTEFSRTGWTKVVFERDLNEH